MEMNMDDSSLTVWLAIVRAIHFASCLLTAGVWWFDRLIIRETNAQWRRLALTILLIATPLALVSEAAWFVLVTANMSGSSFAAAIHNPDILKLVWSRTRFGRCWQFHLVFWFTGLVATAMWAAFERGRWIGWISGVGLTTGLAWAGHGSASPLRNWHLAMDLLHLLASSLWPAGLVPLGFLLSRMMRSPQPGKSGEISKIVRRFSACSLLAVGVLTLTGLFNSWCLLGSFAALTATSYGQTLLVKLILFTAMIGLGAINLLVLKPRLAESDIASRRLLRNVIFEIALGSAVVLAVGLLGLLEPPPVTQQDRRTATGLNTDLHGGLFPET